MYPNFSEFGLYRYENASSRLRNKRNGIYSSAVVYSIVAMTVIFAIILYIFVGSRTIAITNRLTANGTRRHSSGANSTSGGLEVIELAARNSSELHSRRIKRLDSADESNQSPEQQKLILFPTRAFKQPRIAAAADRKNAMQYAPLLLPPNHKLSPRSRPFRRQSTLMPKPNEFLKPPTGRSHSLYQQVNSIQDILKSNHRVHYQPVAAAPHFAHPNHNNQAQHMSQFAQFSHNQMRAVPVQLTGKYRHPRTNGELAHIFQQSQGGQALQAEGSDPFRNFKPVSAYDINQLLTQDPENQQRFVNAVSTDSPYFRRKFRQKMARQKEKHAAIDDRTEGGQSKPFSVMLDVFPLPGEENELNQQQAQQQQQLMQMQKLARLRPLMSRYYQDPQFFNTMNFPQLTPRYPPYFRYQQQQQQQSQASANHGVIQSGNEMHKPSQLIVHLNLYPKQNAAGFKRSSTEDEDELRLKRQQLQHEEARQQKVAMQKNQTLDISSSPFNINFNVLAGNAHPENVMYHKIREFNRTSTEATQSQDYLYDDDDDDEFDQSIGVAPSLVYKHIFRDRPVHMMLRNRTATTTTPTPIRLPSVVKTNQKYEYQAINRPRTRYFDYIPRTPNGGPFYR